MKSGGKITGIAWCLHEDISRFVYLCRPYFIVAAPNANGLSFEPKPDTTNPLGVVFPGTVFNEPGLPNWVGHLITKLELYPCSAR